MTKSSNPQLATSTAFRVLQPGDFEDFQRLRADAVVRHPQAYSASPGEDSAPDEDAARARLLPTPDHRIVGAFRLGAMVGMLGLARLRPRKLAHRANLWGAYVAPDLRGQGIGRSLLRLVLAEALRRPDLRQLNASVYSDSAAARQLFQGAGFKCWGLARQAAKVDGVYVDEEHYALQLVRNIRETPASFESAPSSGIRRST
jgi:RimJ/RimL family protein N-acetyltransferase